MKIMVTGAAGFIGSHLVDKLLDNKHDVYAVDDLSGGYKKNLNIKSNFFKLDLRDTDKTSKLVNKIKPQIIYHLSADAAESKSQFSPINCLTRNYLSTVNLLVPSINNNLKRFVFASSMAVYGSQKPPFMESTSPKPDDIYAVTKFSSEMTIKILSQVHGFEYVIVRPHNVYGPRQNMADPYRNAVAIFINKLLKGEDIYIYGDGHQKRAFSYIADVITAIYKCGIAKNAAGKTINIGSDNVISVNYLADKLMDITGIKTKISHMPFRPQEVKYAYSDHTLAKKVLGYKDATGIDEGLRKTWEWAKRNGCQQPVYYDVEIKSAKYPKAWRKRMI